MRSLQHSSRWALAAVLVLVTARARAQESMASFPDGGLPVGKINDPDVPPVAHRLFDDLECTCGQCRHMKLSACPCGFASGAREEIMAMLQGRDLSTPEKEDAAYREVREAVVTRYGKRALASRGGRSRIDPFSMGLLIFLGASTLGLLGYVVVTSRRARRRPEVSRVRARPPKRRRR